VAEPGVEPGLPKRLFYRELSGPSLTSAGEDDGIRTRDGLAHNQAPHLSVRPQSIRQDSNLRTAPCDGAALPLSY
jgi:hypothetical protein